MNRFKKYGLTITLLLFLFSAIKAQEESTRRAKDGFSFGVLPTISFDADLGFQYGGLINLFDYRKPAIYPDYRQMWKLEISRYTKGSGINQLYYDGKHVLPHRLRVIANLAYLTEQKLDFFGFNGYQRRFNPIFIDDITRVFYMHERRQFRFNSQLIGHLPWNGFFWMGGIGVFHTEVGTVDINRLNRGVRESEKLPEGAPTLYDKYVEWGVIPENEKNGGWTNHFRAGIMYDTRDIEANPSRGIWAEAVLFYAPDFFFNRDVNYLKLSATFRQYITLMPDRLSFAYRLKYQGTIGGHAPFYIQPYMIKSFTPKTKLDGLGGGKSIRGVMRNRVVGDGFLLGNAELRWKMFNTVVARQNFYLGLTAFADAGMVVQQIQFDKSRIPDDELARHFNHRFMNQDGLHPGVGLGLRAALNENFILAIDYGLPLNSQDGQGGGLYISIGNLF